MTLNQNRRCTAKMSESLYRELPAGQIRLLRLVPNADVQDLKYSLETLALDAAPVYIALSYTWSDERGDTTLTRAIIVNGQRLGISLNPGLYLLP